MRRYVTTAVLALALGAATTAVVRAVSVSPMAVFLDHSTRAGTITLYNPNPLPEEIDISFAFGYPQSDSAGVVTVPLTAEAPADAPAAVSWLRAFPRRLVLQPGQQQVVRILAQPPADLADGEYWSRVLVTATGGRPPVEQQVQPDVRVAISMRTIVVASLSYRKGQPVTGIRVDSAAAVRTDGGVQLTLDMARTGAAAYLGRVRVELLDAAGSVIAEEVDVVAVYYELRRRFVFADVPGAARVRYTFETERPELGQSNIITAPPVSGALDVR
ncbi:MAG: hypothetical protein WEB88_07070 [Gemmatimonadota bacterium]